MEYPWTSKLAQVVAFFSLTMVIISTITFVISTIEEFQEFPIIGIVIEYIDTFTVFFFTLEYAVRIICSPLKFKFMKTPMNMVDFMAITPFYLAMLLEGLEDFKIIGKAGKIVRLVRVLRFLRIFKLVRHFAGLQSLLYTLQQAYKVNDLVDTASLVLDY